MLSCPRLRTSVSPTPRRVSVEDCGAYKLADEYMAKYYPEWYERYPIKLADPEVYLNFEGEHTGMLIWDETGERMSDPDGVTEMTPAEVLEFIFAS